MAANVVTISAQCGTGGTIIGRLVAQRLRVPFLDGAIPTKVARSLAVSLEEAVAHDERVETRMDRMLAALAGSGLGFAFTSGPRFRAATYRDETERAIRAAAKTTTCVILGRAAAIVLHDYPSVLHVCLIGTLRDRVRRAWAEGSAEDDEHNVRKFVKESDRIRRAYFRGHYGAYPDDPGIYDVIIDSARLGFDNCADLIATTAARIDSVAV